MEKGNFKGMLPLVIFLVLYMFTGLSTGSFENMPLMIGISIACAVALMMNKKGDKKSFDEKVTIFCKGAGDHTLILMVIIFMLAGAFYGVANAMHAVDSVSNLGLSILPSNMILPGIFLIACLLSFAMGTSMGTVAALAPIAIDIADKTGSNVALLCGIVVGGAMFGDNLSFISDTTIAATRTQEVTMKSKFKANILIVIPAVIINVIILALQPIDTSAITGGTYSYNLVNILPYLLVIILSLAGINVINVMTLGVMSGLVIGLAHGDFGLTGFMKTIHEGMMGMQDMAIIAILVGGLVAVMKYLGGIDWLLYNLTKGVKTKRGAEFSIAALVSLIDIATTNNTISIIAAGPLARGIADRFDISRSRTASILDLFSSAFNGLLPYAGQLLVVGGLAGVSPVSIMPYNWYSMLMIAAGCVSILLQIPTIKDERDVKATETEVTDVQLEDAKEVGTIE
ncbi:Na+/H+ antiporter NhaC family protein [Enterococcus hulanensis]|uniref:Na+/H+ antiporter NhaC family protein n=1 Tax=Enterococcus hulanensis TaxID=2559929 RepID=A0ABU3EUX2_9ENTE|nr:Na+/H+ antiporter NhaC family protein [Enterococcus hulanensis]MDT2598670.1 Na+/H+ antiporter NhaC family protein [Enterococcus hulanensis]MDT2607825.1 Na+/H+ antiporter NhaC family protein [Enterococcus hulanensis]MDT2615120.1 Na+/H+ antiporter NhaC family protein [Enterococcus hulanensis]MDT2626909.1 Na+/H+ antiporter NhaC family protein [Enterococcus hulanensis]MDT2654192.1 Na+/H+ antiporter NhaC family protein [Enterococcus hulanensis]